MTSLLEKTYIRIIPVFSRDELTQAVPGDCSGEKYQGEIFDENLTEEKVRMSTLDEFFRSYLSRVG